MKNIIICLALILYTSYSFGQSRATSKADSIEVIKTVNNFVDAFSNLRWEEFRQYFAKDATAFFPPSANHPARTENGEEVLNIFSKVFENAKQHNKSKIDIQPKEVRVQMLNNCAIVSFHLNDPDLFGRRTLILEKRNNKWLIVHLHASGVPYK
ncbi:MAG TPA: nuclear transport factor 2 family protein [Cyclobacteriaceae bacterium]|jgi:ketosteroid isomerase-like protein|nr:nuclear transport factor 2 family protein [Cyclobacteriaceae bacterium]